MRTHPTRLGLLLCALLGAAALGGCASGVSLNKAPVEAASATPVGAAGSGAVAGTQPQDASGQAQVAPIQAQDNGTSGSAQGPGLDTGRSVYFAYDSYAVDPKYNALLQANAQFLAAHPAAHVRLEGNTDARGSREYNLALGQKRADAVMKGLELLGVKSEQLEAVSYGKEKPKALGDSEADYAQNRRVDLNYQP